MNEGTAEELQRFLVDNIETYEELELLVWFRSGSQGSCSVEQLASQLSIPEHIVVAGLDSLVARGLLARDPSLKGLFYYAPVRQELHHGAGVLCDEYQRNRLHVIHLMTTNALERLRGSTLRTFADCFRVRGPKRDG